MPAAAGLPLRHRSGGSSGCENSIKPTRESGLARVTWTPASTRIAARITSLGRGVSAGRRNTGCCMTAMSSWRGLGISESGIREMTPSSTSLPNTAEQRSRGEVGASGQGPAATVADPFDQLAVSVGHVWERDELPSTTHETSDGRTVGERALRLERDPDVTRSEPSPPNSKHSHSTSPTPPKTGPERLTTRHGGLIASLAGSG